MSLAFQNYSRYIKDMNLSQKDTRRCSIWPTMKSTELMTKLRHRYVTGTIDKSCEDPYDVLFAILSNRRYRQHINLIIVYDIPGTLIKELDKDYYEHIQEYGKPNRITFTNFKKSRVSKWISIDEERRNEDIEYGEGHVLHIWNRPFILEACTDYDKDFRKIWINGDLEYEGNNYGDTTEFYIIGSVERTYFD